MSSAPEGIRTPDLLADNEASTPGCSTKAFRMAQEGVEPSASLVLSEGGLPVAYRATCVIRRVVKDPESARRESNPPVRRGKPVPRPLGQGHGCEYGVRGSNSRRLVGSQGSCR